MRNYNISFFGVVFCLLISFTGRFSAHSQSKNHQEVDQLPLKLWYKQAARGWDEALPIGNGRLSAMVFGKTDQERIQINEESVWGGHRFNADNPGSLKALPEIRKLLFSGKLREAEALVASEMIGTPPEIRSYQTLMDLNLKMWPGVNAEDYSRALDLRTGIAFTRYKINGVTYEQEVFIPVDEDVLVVHLSSPDQALLNMNLSLSREKDASTKAMGNHMLLLEGQITDEEDPKTGPAGLGMKFAGLLKVVTDGGESVGIGHELHIKNARSITIYITGATNYNAKQMDLDERINVVDDCMKRIKALKGKEYGAIKLKHSNSHAALMNRVELNFSGITRDEIPTDLRLETSRNGNMDLHIAELYFQFGRYLLLGSSGGAAKLPANLQGKWNQEITAPWDSDYHNNINLQMNYWPAEVTNLPETVSPLIDMLKKWSVTGRESARNMYGAKGWVMHHCTDIFGKNGARDGVWGVSALSGQWLSLHLWEHYSFSLDKIFLKRQAWPVMKGSADFLLDFLIEGPDGKLVTAPSVSPENRYMDPADGQPLYITYSPAIDIQVIEEFLDKCIRTAEILNTDHAFVARLKALLKRLHPTQIDATGRVMEWVKPYGEVEKGHRHMSHLFALYPGTRINQNTPSLLAAARKTLSARLENGGGNNGWSRAWMINFYARLQDGNSAWFQFNELLTKSTLINLFDSYDSLVPFQIDGNFGGTAGIAEMLLQSHQGTIELLPALPDNLRDGKVSGLKARGNFELGMKWKDGNLTEATISSPVGGSCRVVYKNLSVDLVIKKNEQVTLSGTLK